MNTITKRASTGLKSLSITGMLALVLAAALAPGFTATPASAQAAAGGGNPGGGNNPPGGDGGNANYGPAPWAAAILCDDNRRCPPPVWQRPAPVVQVPANQQCGGQQIVYDKKGNLIRQACPQQLTQAQLNKLRH